MSYTRPATTDDLSLLSMFTTKEKVELLKSRIEEVIITQSDFNDPTDFTKFVLDGKTVVYINGY